MNSIIALTDFSANASNAVQYAAALAQAAGARLILFHHFSYPVTATDLPTVIPIYVDELAADLEDRLKKIKAGLEEEYPGLEVKVLVRSWVLMLDLEEVFRQEAADLVVLGMQGESPVLNTLFGSVTARLIREGRMPAIVVPATAAFRAPKRILFAYSFDPDTDPHTLRPLNLLAAQFGAYVRVLTFFKEDKTPATVAVMQESATQKKLDGLLEGLRHGYRLEAGPDDLPGGILEQAAHYQADLVAVIPHHHGFFENLFNRSVTREMVARTQTPLLVLPEKRLDG